LARQYSLLISQPVCGTIQKKTFILSGANCSSFAVPLKEYLQPNADAYRLHSFMLIQENTGLMPWADKATLQGSLFRVNSRSLPNGKNSVAVSRGGQL